MASFGAASNTNPNRSAEVTSPPTDSVSSLSFSPKANVLVATSWDSQVQCWEIMHSGSNISSAPKAFITHEQPVLCSAWKDDGTTVFTGGCDKQVKMWLLLSGGQPVQVAMHDGPVKEIDWIPEKNLLVSGSSDRTLSWTGDKDANLSLRCFPIRQECATEVPDLLGTTICCLTYSDGIILGADSRRIQLKDGLVVSDTIIKMHELHESLFIILAGSTDKSSKVLRMLREKLSAGARKGCTYAAGLLAEIVKGMRVAEMGNLNLGPRRKVGAILGGMDFYSGELQLFVITNSGDKQQVGHAAIGHGGMIAQQHLDKEVKAYTLHEDKAKEVKAYTLHEDKAKNIVRDALALAERKTWTTGGPMNVLIFPRVGKIKRQTAVPPESMLDATPEDYVWVDDAFYPNKMRGAGTEDGQNEARKLAKRAKRIPLEIGPSSYASRKKMKMTQSS